MQSNVISNDRGQCCMSYSGKCNNCFGKQCMVLINILKGELSPVRKIKYDISKRTIFTPKPAKHPEDKERVCRLSIYVQRKMELWEMEICGGQ